MSETSHGPYWALFNKNGKPNLQLYDKPGRFFWMNARDAGKRVAQVMLVELPPGKPPEKPSTSEETES